MHFASLSLSEQRLRNSLSFPHSPLYIAPTPISLPSSSSSSSFSRSPPCPPPPSHLHPPPPPASPPPPPPSPPSTIFEPKIKNIFVAKVSLRVSSPLLPLSLSLPLISRQHRGLARCRRRSPVVLLTWLLLTCRARCHNTYAGGGIRAPRREM